MTVKIAVVSLGCAKNQVDSEVMAGILGEQYEITDKPAEAEIIVINTCTFIDAAKEESVDTILEMARYKEEGKCQTLVAVGCMAQRYGEDLLQEIPELDGIMGTGSLGEIAKLVAQAGIEKTRGPLGVPEFLYDEKMPRRRSTPSHYAYVKVAEGCDNYCSYCVIPQVRGHFRSRTEESILHEIREMAAEGVKEILLIAQDTTRYGLDIYGELRLPTLIRKIARLEGIEWIRLMYCYPELFTDELIEVMVQEPKVCRYVDLPLQHSNEKILREMNRRGSAADAERLIDKLRQAMPDIRIRTTLITGFPGETEGEFQELLDFVNRIEFDRLGVFAYSQEENTPAAQRSDQVPKDTRETRRDKVMELQQSISARRQQRWVGQTVKVLLEEELPEGRWLGRTEGDAPEIDGEIYVTIKSGTKLQGDFVTVSVQEADSYDLVGEVVS
ncbi:MAG: 30S ribosomal protein S12 methylthiotransferase RimO [Desulfitobacteriaceae bacterium]